MNFGLDAQFSRMRASSKSALDLTATAGDLRRDPLDAELSGCDEVTQACAFRFGSTLIAKGAQRLIAEHPCKAVGVSNQRIDGADPVIGCLAAKAAV